ncbi:MAG TPA: hypothetical protein VG755_17660 [Nannocystaceae bacterium]|nr:hypothetical protein [Nannocystaceae bacterium]
MLALVAAVRIASAAVQWEAPPGCPDDAALESRIAALVGDPTIVTPATAKVKQVGDRYEVELVTWIDGGSQRRELAATSCEALADAVAVVIAVALDPVEAAETPRIVEATEVAAVGITTTRTPTPALPERVRAPKSPLYFGLALAGGYGSGIAPSGHGIVHVGLALGRRAWSIELDARVWPRREFVRGDPAVRTRVTLGTVGLLGCGKGVFGRVELPVCAGVEVGGLRARGPELVGDAAPRNFPWIAPRARIGLRVLLGRGVGIWTAAEGAVPLAQSELHVGVGADDRIVWSTQPASLRVMLGLDFRWVR